MTQITVTLSKETPFEHLSEVASFILHMASLVHGKSGPATIQGIQHVANVIPFPQTADGSALSDNVSDEIFFGNETEHDTNEVDANGYPWDGRIHAAGKSKNSTGCWRQRRNVKPQVVMQVEAELRNKMAAKANLVTAVIPELPPVPAAPAPLPPLQVAPPPPAAPAAATVAPPPPPAAPAAPVEASQAARPVERSFDELMALVTDILVGEMLAEEDILRIVRNHDVKELVDLATADPRIVAVLYNAVEDAAK